MPTLCHFHPVVVYQGKFTCDPLPAVSLFQAPFVSTFVSSVLFCFCLYMLLPPSLCSPSFCLFVCLCRAVVRSYVLYTFLFVLGPLNYYTYDFPTVFVAVSYTPSFDNGLATEVPPAFIEFRILFSTILVCFFYDLHSKYEAPRGLSRGDDINFTTTYT